MYTPKNITKHADNHYVVLYVEHIICNILIHKTNTLKYVQTISYHFLLLPNNADLTPFTILTHCTCSSIWDDHLRYNLCLIKHQYTHKLSWSCRFLLKNYMQGESKQKQLNFGDLFLGMSISGRRLIYYITQRTQGAYFHNKNNAI